MKTFSSRCRCLGLSTLILCAVMQTALHAQEAEELPFIEPVLGVFGLGEAEDSPKSTEDVSLAFGCDDRL